MTRPVPDRQTGTRTRSPARQTDGPALSSTPEFKPRPHLPRGRQTLQYRLPDGNPLLALQGFEPADQRIEGDGFERDRDTRITARLDAADPGAEAGTLQAGFQAARQGGLGVAVFDRGCSRTGLLQLLMGSVAAEVSEKAKTKLTLVK